MLRKLRAIEVFRFMLFVAFLLSIVVGLMLGMLGGGGSIMSVPILVYVLDTPAHQAVATALVVVGITAVTGSVQHARAGRVRWKVAGVFGLAGMLGAYAGGKAAGRIPGGVLLTAFGLLMFITALAMIRKRQQRVDAAPEEQASLGALAAYGAGLGVITGLLGAGGGFLIVPALLFFGRVPMTSAVGTSLVIIAMNSAAALAGHLAHVTLDWQIAGLITGGAVFGSLIGSSASDRVSPERLRRIFGWFVLAMAVFMLVQQVPAALGYVVAKSRLSLVALSLALATGFLGAILERIRSARAASTPSAPPSS